MALRVGVVGAGMIGSGHIKRLTCDVANVEVVAVADPDQARAAAVADPLGATVHANGYELIHAANVDAVLVTSSGPSHAEYVLASLDACKPVFCEKPLATTQRDCMRIVQAEVTNGRRLVQVGYMRRYDPGYLAMKEAIDNGIVGLPVIVHSAHRNPSVPDHYTKEMAVVDTAVHDIDVCRWLLGQDFVSSQVFLPRHNPRSDGALTDPLFIVLQTDARVLVDVEVDLNIGFGYDVRTEAVCERGIVALSALSPVLVHTAGTARQELPHNWQERFAAAYSTELRHWVASVANQTPTGPSAWDGYQVAVTADATVESLRQGGPVAINQSHMPDLYRDL